MSELDSLQNKLDMWQRICTLPGTNNLTLTPSDVVQLRQEVAVLYARIAELKESDKHWAGNVKVCMQLIERYESAIAELEEIDRMRSEIVSTLNQANANNEDEIELLKKRIAKLKKDNDEFRQLIRDWSIVLDQNNGFQLWYVESVRQAMLEINKERDE